MNDQTADFEGRSSTPQRHPPVRSIEDMTVFKLARLVAVAERFGMRWSEKLFGISVNEWRLLGLTDVHGPVRAGDLAEMMLMDKSQLSRIIKSLTDKKLIKTKPDSKDARAVMLSTTPRGQLLCQDAMIEVLQRNERVVSPLSPEEAVQFHAMLDRLIAHNLTILESDPGR